LNCRAKMYQKLWNIGKKKSSKDPLQQYSHGHFFKGFFIMQCF
jgi:hypothetical protein